MKTVPTKEMKDLFKLFDDIFQFFSQQVQRKINMKMIKNLDKYEWEHLNDLMPLDITTTTGMTADEKISGVGGGVKKT